jgi:hypothetical protein
MMIEDKWMVEKEIFTCGRTMAMLRTPIVRPCPPPSSVATSEATAHGTL